MKYFCPLENVKTISGRDDTEVNGTSTNINGWKISTSGIWAGGKSNDAVGKGKNALGIFSQNWSIGSDGSVIANNGTFKNIYALENNFFIENRSGTHSLNVIHLDNFELIKNNTLKTLTLFGKNTQEPNTSQKIVTIKEDGNYFELDFEQGCCTPYLRFSNPQISKDKYPFIGTNTYGYLNLNDNLTLTASSDYLFDEHSISRSNVGSNISYKYTLPDKSGEIVLKRDFADNGLYFYTIEVQKGCHLGYYSTGQSSTQFSCTTKEDILIQTKTIQKTIPENSDITYYIALDYVIEMSMVGSEVLPADITLYCDSINLKYKDGILNSYTEYFYATDKHYTINYSSRQQDSWNKIIIHRYDLLGTNEKKFKYDLSSKTWKVYNESTKTWENQ